jgi:6-phosphogluconolactonase
MPEKLLSDLDAVAAEVAYRFVRLAAQAIGENGRFTVALSGGKTPEALYRLLAEPASQAQIAWERVHLFWSDERFVPQDRPDSAYDMARRTLLAHVPIPAQNIYPMVTEEIAGGKAEAIAAAQRYETLIRDFFAPAAPRFDLVLLGMGPDGHTASLFPKQAAVAGPAEGLVTAVFHAPKPPPTRLTLTYQAINQAAHVIFLVTGSDKAATLARVFAAEGDVVCCPARGVRPVNGRLLWLLDKAAAAELSPLEVKR